MMRFSHVVRLIDFLNKWAIVGQHVNHRSIQKGNTNLLVRATIAPPFTNEITRQES